jgi:hypothetical protein
MRATKRHRHASALRGAQTGSAAVELAIVAIIFFTLLFSIMEIARAMYICNTLQEVTRRAAQAASYTDFTDTGAMQRIHEDAVFRQSPGTLLFAEPVTDAHVRIDYLAITQNGATLGTAPVHPLPASPDENHETCMRERYSARCIRLVRVRICQPGEGNQCDPVPYRPLVSLIPLSFALPVSTTMTVAESLGRPAGLPPGPG